MSFITDAMAATGMTDGVYHLGPVEVDVVDGVAQWRERTPSRAARRPWTASSASPSTTAGWSATRR